MLFLVEYKHRELAHNKASFVVDAETTRYAELKARAYMFTPLHWELVRIVNLPTPRLS